MRRLDRVGGTATILVTDLVGSTAMFDRLGDEKAERLLRSHLGELREHVKAFGGVEVKSTGDGIMAAFPAAWLATECAVAMQRSLHLRNEEGRDEPLHIRIGLHSGDTTADRHDYYGIAVAAAARLCDTASSDGILVSGVTRGLVGSRGGHAFTDAGVSSLKGIDEPVRAWSLEWGPGQLPPAPPPGLERRRGPLVGAASAALVLVVGGIFVMARGDEPKPAPPPVAEGEVFRVSVRRNGGETTGTSRAGEISGTASYVVFESTGSNLVPRDGNGETDVFHVELSDGVVPETLRLVSRKGGVLGNGPSTQPSVSADGEVVAFLSKATNLAVRADENGAQDVFMNAGGKTSRVSISTTGVAANKRSFEVDVSGDGNYIAFTTAATNLAVQGDRNKRNDIFVRDIENEKTNRANIRSGTLDEADRNSSDPSISDGGEYVAFASPANDLARGDTNNKSDVFRYNRTLHKTVRASLPTGGAAANAAGASSQPSISAEGTRIAFVSTAENLVEADASDDPDVFVYDFLTKETILVTPGGAGGGETGNPVISGDGNYVAFDSTAPLVPGDTNRARDVFLYDLGEEVMVLVSIDENGDQVDEGSYDPSISHDGSFVAFTSEGSLVETDTNEVADVYVRGPLR
ncbi:MAG TPA: adenylate/guanylate cyclase domain-containing protein [Actinomycetota bacterium]|nr:adenylate/guanylate cyclase domain-containing protein [Actinomycetota bacterium]